MVLDDAPVDWAALMSLPAWSGQTNLVTDLERAADESVNGAGEHLSGKATEEEGDGE